MDNNPTIAALVNANMLRVKWPTMPAQILTPMLDGLLTTFDTHSPHPRLTALVDEMREVYDFAQQEVMRRIDKAIAELRNEAFAPPSEGEPS